MRMGDVVAYGSVSYYAFQKVEANVAIFLNFSKKYNEKTN